ncbi:hypothetical protein CEXT_480381 [Caerostris extrusa]|uniref:Uncharacterized protein n=1 Tax=Caerostris extrusa TaxID=172846 RepID=A0AAV4XFD0_CAEEX|nr:hypothetical protein CEXT_480381 [Caerostris extrusa]
MDTQKNLQLKGKSQTKTPRNNKYIKSRTFVVGLQKIRPIHVGNDQILERQTLLSGRRWGSRGTRKRQTDRRTDLHTRTTVEARELIRKPRTCV